MRVLNAERLSAVEATGLLDTPAEESFDRFARLARGLLDVPFVFITLVDDSRSFWKSCIGIDETAVESRQNPVGESFCQYVIEIDGPLIVADTRLNPLTSSNPSIVKMGVVAWAGYPLRSAEGHVLGTFCAVDVVPHEWTSGEVEVLSTLAAAAENEVGLRSSLENSQLDRVALRKELARREQMADLSKALNAAETTLAIAAIVTDSGARLLGAPSASVALLDDSRQHVVVHHPATFEATNPKEDRTLSLSDRTELSDAINARSSILVHDSVERGVLYPHLVDEHDAMGLVAMAAIPLFRSDGSILGALGIGWDSRKEFDVDDVALLNTVASMCASAIQRAQLGDLRGEMVRTLQRELLPSIPEIVGLGIAVRYLPAHHGLGFGGDWYDVIDLIDGRAAVVVGDIAGHGIQAAARMAQVRAAVNALIRLQPDDLSSIFDDAERMLDHLHERYIATVSIAMIDLGRETITYVSAGHIPGLLICAAGETVVLEDGRRPLLGMGGDTPTPSVRPFRPGDTLLSFTDGLVETRTRTFDDGTLQVADIARRGVTAEAGVDEIIAAVVDGLLADITVGDDVAVVVIQSTRAER